MIPGRRWPRVFPVAIAVAIFGLLLTGAIAFREHDDASELAALILLVAIRALPYVELVIAAILLDRSEGRDPRLAIILASAVVVVVDAVVSRRVFWNPEAGSTSGVAVGIAVLALVTVLIPGAVIAGYFLAPKGSNAPRG